MRYGAKNKELRQRIANARLRPTASKRDARIYKAVREICTDGTVHYVLDDIPDQREDCFVVLAGDKLVISFELDRENENAGPTEVKTWTVPEYCKEVGQRNSHRLEIALEYVREEFCSTKIAPTD